MTDEKNCDRCGKPKHEWPNSYMTGEQKQGVGFGLLGLCALALVSVVGLRYCEADKQLDAQKAQADAQKAVAAEKARVDVYNACLAQSHDPALCSGKVETVRCLK